jgi:hypothetical protein
MDDALNTFTSVNLKSSYYNISNLNKLYNEKNSPLLISLNIQSLQSKFEKLLNFINELNQSGIIVDIIAIQETWKIHHPDLFAIPGFHPLITSNRADPRGVGLDSTSILN